jgi:hypothetical protein
MNHDDGGYGERVFTNAGDSILMKDSQKNLAALRHILAKSLPFWQGHPNRSAGRGAFGIASGSPTKKKNGSGADPDR